MVDKNKPLYLFDIIHSPQGGVRTHMVCAYAFRALPGYPHL
jgi:hypothetical protein